MDELGLGVRLPTFEFEDAQLGEAIERLVADEALAGRLKALSAAAPGRAGHRAGRRLHRDRLAPRAARTRSGLKPRRFGPITWATCTTTTASSGM